MPTKLHELIGREEFPCFDKKITSTVSWCTLELSAQLSVLRGSVLKEEDPVSGELF